LALRSIRLKVEYNAVATCSNECYSHQSDPVDMAITVNDQHTSSNVNVQSMSECESGSCRAVGGIAEVVMTLA